MPDIINPYIPGQPVGAPELFFGRRDVIASIRGHLLSGRRVFGVFAPPRMGKSSLIRQLSLHTPDGFVLVRLDLAEEDAQTLDQVLACLTREIRDGLSRMLAGASPGEPATGDVWDDGADWLSRYWPEIRSALGADCLVLAVDDLDVLARRDGQTLDSVLSFFADWREQDSQVALVLTMTEAWQDSVLRQNARLFGGALTYVLGPLSSEESTHLITWPVDDVLTYDYGVARRIVEITSGQPYYLQLVCFELFNRCVAAGWATQRDLDIVLDDLVEREIGEFRRIWDESRSDEQAALAALVSLRGSRGVATAQEVRTVLTKAGARVAQEQVAATLDDLAMRGILERLGALSFRFRVPLLRDWLSQRLVLQDVARTARWEAAPPVAERDKSKLLKVSGRRARRRPLESGEKSYEVEADPADLRTGPGPRARRTRWIVLGLAAVVCAALVVAALAGAFRSGPEEPTLEGTAVSTSLALATATLTQPPSSLSTATTMLVPPTASPLPEPTATPSPTAPLVVARSVPSIAYQSRARGETRWSIYVMSSDGSNRERLADGQSEFLAPPAWSPDGSKLSFVLDQGDSSDIWVMNSDGSGLVNLTKHEAKDHWPAWSPDGELIAFASVRDSLYWELYVMRADGSDVERLTWWEDASDLSPTWSPDGTRLGFSSKRDGNLEIYTMDRGGGNLLRLTHDPADDTSPAWSPDGSRIAFASTREGYSDIFVVPVVGGPPENLSRAPFSSEHGPTWSPDGGRIAFYSDREGQWDIWVMASDGSDPVRLTGAATNDQVPAWRP